MHRVTQAAVHASSAIAEGKLFESKDGTVARAGLETGTLRRWY